MKLLSIALACGLAMAAKVAPPPAGSPPHVIVFLIDDWGHNDLSYYNKNNENYIQSPFMDSKASSGLLMDNAYVQPICSPTRSQLLSGRYQIHTGLQHGVIRPSQANGLPLNMSIIPNYLKQASNPYATYAVGKWHIGFYTDSHCPWSRGFDHYTGYLIGAEDYYLHTRSYGKEEGYDMRNGSEVFWSAKNEYSADIFTDQAVSYIHMHAAKYGNTKPLFMYVPLQNVHAPLQDPPNGLVNRFKDIGSPDRRTYAAMVLAADMAIANISKAMWETGLESAESPTVNMVMQDNGGQVHAGGNNWPLRGNKGGLWEGSFKTRMALWGTHPAVNSSRTYDGLWHVSDLLPTIVQGIAGVDVSKDGLDGVNQWPNMVSGGPSPRTEILHNIDPILGRAAIRSGDMKLLLGAVGENDWFIPAGWTPPASQKPPVPGPEPDDTFVGLFNITADPLEHNNLASSMPDMVKQMRARLEVYNATAVPCRYPDDDPNSDPSRHGGAWGPWL